MYEIGTIVSPDTAIEGYSGGGSEAIVMVDDILGMRIIPDHLMRWHTDEAGDKQLTLGEITAAVHRLGLKGRIYVWEQKPRDGYIYQCGNYKPG